MAVRPARGTVRGMIAKDFPSLKDLPLISCGSFVIMNGAGTAAGRSWRNGQARPADADAAGSRAYGLFLRELLLNGGRDISGEPDVIATRR